MPIPRRRSRPLRKRPRFDDLADDEPESSSDSTSSESYESSPPPDFAADADDEEGYISAPEETESPKPQPKRPSRLAKPRSFIDAVRPYVEPMSRDAIKLSQLTMAEITAGAAYRGPLVVTDADRAEVEAAHAAAARLARHESDDLTDDREEVIPQIETRAFSLKRQRFRSRNSELSNSDYEMLSRESGSDSASEPEADGSPRSSAPADESPTSRCNEEKRYELRRESSDYESENNGSPSKNVIRLVRSDKIGPGRCMNDSDNESCDSRPDHITSKDGEESSSSACQTLTGNFRTSDTYAVSRLDTRARNTQRHSERTAPTASNRVIDVIDLSQDHDSSACTRLPRTETVRARSVMRRSTSSGGRGPSTRSCAGLSQAPDVIDLCGDSGEEGSGEEVPKPTETEVVDLCLDGRGAEAAQMQTLPKRRLRIRPGWRPIDR